VAAPLLQSEYTTFTLDNMGRYLCNTLQEALDSANVVIGNQKRDFDVIVVGGGSFGCAIAEALFTRDKSRGRRILVLEQGPFVLPEHVQNLPFMGGTPSFTKPWVNDPALDSALQYPGLLFAVGGRSIAWGGWAPEPLHDPPKNDEMINWPAAAINELQQTYYSNAAVTIGVAATNDFISGPLQRALRKQFYDALVASPPSGLVLNDLPDHPIVREFRKQNGGAAPSAAQLRVWLDLPPNDATPLADLLNMIKLEAPLAVQATTEPGFFPFNKFSAIPLVIQAARVTSGEADGTGPEADARKRLIIVPSCHVQELITQTQPDGWVHVTGVRAIDRTGASVDVSLKPPQSDGSKSVVVLALGTIESTRVALTTFRDSLSWRAAQRMGENFLAHLRSNLTIRVPKSALTSPIVSSPKHIPVSAMFVKGKKNIGGQDKFFHFQITASGLSDLGNNSEAFLFKKVPDAELVNAMAQADAATVVITIRGIGQMSLMNPDSRVGLAQTPGDIDFNRPKAYANFGNALAPTGGSQQTQDDRTLWGFMDDFADQIALMFVNKQPFEILMKSGTVINVKANATATDLKQLRTVANGGALQNDIRDALGTTHHEAGTMRMSDDPAKGVTNDFGRIHDSTNCYVVGPALLPATGSPNPMLTGVAMAERTATLLTDSVLQKPLPFNVAAPWKALFDGTGVSFNRWVRVSPANSSGFALINGEIVTYGTKDFGLLYYAAQPFNNFTLKAQVRVFSSVNRNSGIFIRFRDPLLDLPQNILQRISTVNEIRQDLPTDMNLFNGNRAWGAVYSGFEVQIDDNAEADPRKTFYGPSEPGGLRKNRTGAIYKIPAKDPIPNTGLFDVELQTYNPAPSFRNGSWYEFTIDVNGDAYSVNIRDLDLNTAVTTTTFQNTDGARGVATESGKPVGFIGLQSHPGSPVAFRNIQIKS
jgi:choline dehydrogenase-like flavoprotein